MNELDGMETFIAVADAKGFRAAGERLGVSGSAVSQTIRRLEQRLGIALVHRTTRSVRLTEAGERLYAAVRPALDEIRAAALAVGDLADRPRGTLRLSVSGSAASVLRGALLDGFLAAFPEVNLDVIVTHDTSDIVAGGFDAGIRLGEVIDQDMIAVAASVEQRLLVVGAPSYFARHAAPAHPRDLASHTCFAWRASLDTAPYRWEFTEDGRDFSVAVDARVTSNDVHLLLRLAATGAGLTACMEEIVRAPIASGELMPVLEAYSPPFPGYFLYYPQRRHMSPPLRALVDFLRRARRD